MSVDSLLQQTMCDLWVHREQWISDCIRKDGDPELTTLEQIRDFSLATNHAICDIGSYQAVMWHREKPIGVYAERREDAGIRCFACDHVPNELPDGFNHHLLNPQVVNGPVELWGDD